MLTPRLIMVVDDEHMVEQMIETHLERLNCAHASFHDALAAMDFFADNYKHVHLVILDQTMPVMPGDKVAKEMRQIAPNRPIIIMTGHLYTDENKEYISRVLHKPVLKADLIEAIRALLGPSACATDEKG